MVTDENCAPEGIRTPNLLIRSQMLYPLSYGRDRRGLTANLTTISAGAAPVRRLQVTGALGRSITTWL